MPHWEAALVALEDSGGSFIGTGFVGGGLIISCAHNFTTAGIIDNIENGSNGSSIIATIGQGLARRKILCRLIKEGMFPRRVRDLDGEPDAVCDIAILTPQDEGEELPDGLKIVSQSPVSGKIRIAGYYIEPGAGRHKEEINADILSVTQGPGWLTAKPDNPMTNASERGMSGSPVRHPDWAGVVGMLAHGKEAGKGTALIVPAEALCGAVQEFWRRRKRAQQVESEPAGSTAEDMPLEDFKTNLASIIARSPHAIDAIKVAGRSGGVVTIVDFIDSTIRLPFENGLDILKMAYEILIKLKDKGERNVALTALREVAKHLVPYLFYASEGVPGTKEGWQRLSGGGLISLKTGHVSFAEIIIAGLERRPLKWEKVDTPGGTILRGATSVGRWSNQPPSGIKPTFDSTLREELWRKLNPPKPPGRLTPEKQDEAINQQLEAFALRRGVRFYIFYDDFQGGDSHIVTQWRADVSTRYRALAIVTLDPGLYQIHADLLRDMEHLVCE